LAIERSVFDAWVNAEVTAESRKSMLMGGEPINAAMVHVGRWRFALKMQSDRMVKARSEPVTDFVREIDLQFFIFALRQFLRSVELVKKRTPKGPQQEISAAMDAFAGAVPGWKDTRDLLEHFDEYESGTGRAKKRVGAPTITWYERSPDLYSVNVSIPGWSSVTIEFRRAVEAADVLLEAVSRVVVRLRDA
jgi:hypothetical protein